MAVDRVGRHAGSCSYIQGSTHNHENKVNTNNLGCMRYSVYAVHGGCCTQCMLCGTRCMLYSVHAILGV